MPTWVLGTDEAGYGPNLGPLVVAGTLWQLDRPADVQEILRGCRSDQADAGANAGADAGANAGAVSKDLHLIADSKRVFRRADGLAPLERVVLAALGCRCRGRWKSERDTRWQDLWATFDVEFAETRPSVAWYQDFDASLPLATSWSDIEHDRAVLLAAWDDRGWKLQDIRCRVVGAAEFNHAVRQVENKAEALALWTLELVRRLAAQVDGPLLVLCDKLGGRNSYTALLQTVFPDSWISPRLETAAKSIYQWEGPHGIVELRFTAKGEQFMPSALSSMVAKYLREAAMTALNAFWSRHVEGLRPTAGYPVDARRFHNDIATAQRRLRIPDQDLWRSR